MYHLELHKFPNNFARFNMSAEDVFAVAVRWVNGEWVELGDRKWNPQEARLTVLEGPRIPVDRLRVGRGWRTAQREAKDVTEQVLAQARERISAPQPAVAPDQAPQADRADAGAAPPAGDRAPSVPATDAQLLADSIGLQLLTLLDQGEVALSDVWELAFARLAGGPPSEALALAERAVRSLLASRLIVLITAGGPVGEETQVVGEGEVDRLLGSTASWSENGDGSRPLIRRLR